MVLTSQQVPERIQLLLGMRHTSDLLLGIVDSLSDVACQIFEGFSETILLWSGFSGSSLVLGGGGDSSIRIKAANDTIGFSQDLTALFDEWFDGVHQLLFVELLFWLALGSVNGL